MRLLSIAFVVLLTGCNGLGSGRALSQDGSDYHRNDGTSEEQAILTLGLYQSGPDWIAGKYPGSTVKMHELVDVSSERRYDLFTVQKADGETIQVWFRLPGRPDSIRLK